ncbi:MAG: glycoside hydrolase family 25 protein [Oscillospiraceae bacterium]|nr:glycoside hydrolase family 25 protein [Oscillospiraceae bacterium]
MMKIIDVSRHNGTINWEMVRADGVEGVILRAGYGRLASQKDSMFEVNYNGAKAAGLYTGVYFYTYAKSPDEAETEAEVFLEWIKGKSFELPVYFDIEDASISHLGRNVLTDICIRWCGKVEKAGYYTGIYANVHWFRNKLDLNRLAPYDKWLAHWAEAPAFDESFGGMWQYSSTGKVSGIKGNVDLNRAYRDYPRIIRNAGLNGLKRASGYSVSAQARVTAETSAQELAGKCRMLGMTAEVKAITE